MNLQEFINKLFALFPSKLRGEAQRIQIEFYSEMLATDKDFDYDKLMRIIGDRYTYSTLPTVAEIKSWREECVLEEQKKNQEHDAGQVVLILLENNDYYVFTVDACAKKSVRDVTDSLKRKYNIKKVRMFPEGTTITPNRIFYPNGDCYDFQGNQITSALQDEDIKSRMREIIGNDVLFAA